MPLYPNESSTVTFPITLPAGSVANQAINISGSTTTGIGSNTGNAVSIYCSNAEIMRIQPTTVSSFQQLNIGNTGSPQPILYTGRLQTNIPAGNIFTPTTGQTVTLLNSYTDWIINPAGTLATLTINMPTSPNDGLLIRVKCTQTITALTVSGNGNSIVGAPTSITVGGGLFECQWNQANTIWYCG